LNQKIDQAKGHQIHEAVISELERPYLQEIGIDMKRERLPAAQVLTPSRV
jgi:hypothetical protein